MTEFQFETLDELVELCRQPRRSVVRRFWRATVRAAKLASLFTGYLVATFGALAWWLSDFAPEWSGLVGFIGGVGAVGCLIGAGEVASKD